MRTRVRTRVKVRVRRIVIFGRGSVEPRFGVTERRYRLTKHSQALQETNRFTQLTADPGSYARALRVALSWDHQVDFSRWVHRCKRQPLTLDHLSVDECSGGY